MGPVASNLSPLTVLSVDNFGAVEFGVLQMLYGKPLYMSLGVYAYVLQKEKLVAEEFQGAGRCGAGRQGRGGSAWMVCLPASYAVFQVFC